jgi:hypothetical protein
LYRKHNDIWNQLDLDSEDVVDEVWQPAIQERVGIFFDEGWFEGIVTKKRAKDQHAYVRFSLVDPKDTADNNWYPWEEIFPNFSKEDEDEESEGESESASAEELRNEEKEENEDEESIAAEEEDENPRQCSLFIFYFLTAFYPYLSLFSVMFLPFLRSSKGRGRGSTCGRGSRGRGSTRGHGSRG